MPYVIWNNQIQKSPDNEINIEITSPPWLVGTQTKNLLDYWAFFREIAKPLSPQPLAQPCLQNIEKLPRKRRTGQEIQENFYRAECWALSASRRASAASMRTVFPWREIITYCPSLLFFSTSFLTARWRALSPQRAVSEMGVWLFMDVLVAWCIDIVLHLRWQEHHPHKLWRWLSETA